MTCWDVHIPACCWLAQFSDRACDGRLVRCHLVPAQLLKRESELRSIDRRHGTLWDVIWDSRAWVWGCGGPTGLGGHHGMLDHSRTLRIPREALPPELEEFASELGLEWWLEREYGPRERAA